MPRLLIVHHRPSPALQEMLEAAVSGARTDEITGVEVVIRPALTAAAADVLQADGFLLGTPAALVSGIRPARGRTARRGTLSLRARSGSRVAVAEVLMSGLPGARRSPLECGPAA